jgi:hypothetical protein
VSTASTRRSCWWHGIGPGQQGCTHRRGRRAHRPRRRAGPWRGGFLADLRAELKADLLDSVLSTPAWPEAVGARRKVGLPDRLQHQLACGLGHPVADGRDPQPALLAARLGDQPLPHGQRRKPPRVLEADITACFDELSHSALMDRLRRRIADRRVLGLVKAFSRPASLVRTAAGGRPPAAPRRGGFSHRCSPTWPYRCWTSMPLGPGRRWHRLPRHDRRSAGRPPGGWSALQTTLSSWCRHPPARRGAQRRGRSGAGNDGLRLSEAKTSIRHIDQGVCFLGFRIQRHQQREASGATSTPTRPSRPLRPSRWRCRH